MESIIFVGLIIGMVAMVQLSIVIMKINVKLINIIRKYFKLRIISLRHFISLFLISYAFVFVMEICMFLMASILSTINYNILIFIQTEMINKVIYLFIK